MYGHYHEATTKTTEGEIDYGGKWPQCTGEDAEPSVISPNVVLAKIRWVSGEGRYTMGDDQWDSVEAKLLRAIEQDESD